MDNKEEITLQMQTLLNKQEEIAKLQLEIMKLQKDFNNDMIQLMNNLGSFKIESKPKKFKLDKLNSLKKEAIIKIKKYTPNFHSRKELEEKRQNLDMKLSQFYEKYPAIFEQVVAGTHDKNDSIALEIEETMKLFSEVDKNLKSGLINKTIATMNALKPSNIKGFISDQFTLIKLKKDKKANEIGYKVSQMKKTSVEKIKNSFHHSVNKVKDWFAQRFKKDDDEIEETTFVQEEIKENDEPIVVNDSKEFLLTKNFKNLIKTEWANRKKMQKIKQLEKLINSNTISNEDKERLRQVQINTLTNDDFATRSRSL